MLIKNFNSYRDHRRRDNYRMDCFINYEENLRDWKIKNIINN